MLGFRQTSLPQQVQAIVVQVVYVHQDRRSEDGLRTALDTMHEADLQVLLLVCTTSLRPLLGTW
eukprot:CAMPEP_0181482794 /NCGR_PEP_ID=MMETSP1110-20121109/45059_1 /TAXON_ID=174948 /ORGANISM="Symbiodinium sp., Strain CCMP421" /LENGTH=63 /DNA_ID=CAMNT_0023608425 /DNA_START=307 /DNA_END=498 /DNA_ORIENTATION=+